MVCHHTLARAPRHSSCALGGMATDKHFNEPGGVPELLEDDQPNDMQATLSIPIMIRIVAAVAIAALALFQYVW